MLHNSENTILNVLNLLISNRLQFLIINYHIIMYAHAVVYRYKFNKYDQKAGSKYNKNNIPCFTILLNILVFFKKKMNAVYLFI